jgi:hypothetical protein
LNELLKIFPRAFVGTQGCAGIPPIACLDKILFEVVRDGLQAKNNNLAREETVPLVPPSRLDLAMELTSMTAAPPILLCPTMGWPNILPILSANFLPVPSNLDPRQNGKFKFY